MWRGAACVKIKALARMTGVAIRDQLIWLFWLSLQITQLSSQTNWYTAFRKTKFKRNPACLDLPNEHQDFLSRYFLAILASYWWNLFKNPEAHSSNHLQGCCKGHVFNWRSENLRVGGVLTDLPKAGRPKEGSVRLPTFDIPELATGLISSFFFKIDLVAGTLWKKTDLFTFFFHPF